MKNKLAVVILAAGKSTRMKSGLPKALHPVCSRPMAEYVLDLAKSLKPQKTVCILGFKHQEVRKNLRVGLNIAIQKKLVGTADAVKVALGKLKGFKGTLLVLYGDTPLLTKETVNRLLKRHAESGAAATLLIAELKDPASYGRILRDQNFNVKGIIEDKDADEADKRIKEVNTGIMCFDKAKLDKAIRLVRPDNRKKEYYLTDVIKILYKNNEAIESVKAKDINEALGINSRKELAKANRIMRQRICDKLMDEGVGIVDPTSTFIAYGVKIGRETVIYPFTIIEKNVTIGKSCSIGPFAHLREGTRLDNSIVAGNFIETVRTTIGKNTFAKHLCYLGDSRIGKEVNIGAGAVIANFDGKKKNVTTVGDGVFLGSNSVIVAPVKIGKGAVIGAGSAVIKNVPDKTTVVGVPARKIERKING